MIINKITLSVDLNYRLKNFNIRYWFGVISSPMAPYSLRWLDLQILHSHSIFYLNFNIFHIKIILDVFLTISLSHKFSDYANLKVQFYNDIKLSNTEVQEGGKGKVNECLLKFWNPSFYLLKILKVFECPLKP